MCTGVELLMGALSAAGAASSLMAPKPKPPPTPEIPAIAAPDTKQGNATVRIGQADTKNTDTNNPDGTGQFVETRASGKAIGGLGRSGLAL